MAKKAEVLRAAKSKARARGSASTKSGKFSIPKLLYAQVSPHSIGGMSMFDLEGPVATDIVSNFMSDGDVITRAAQALEAAGFTILQISPYTINIAAPIATYEKAFKTKILPQ
jgi:hypothetical protein